MAKNKPERDDVLRRLLKTPPKPHGQPSQADLDKAAEELGLNDQHTDFGSDAWKKRHGKK